MLHFLKICAHLIDFLRDFWHPILYTFLHCKRPYGAICSPLQVHQKAKTCPSPFGFAKDHHTKSDHVKLLQAGVLHLKQINIIRRQ